MKLKAIDVMRKPTGKHADGGSLYLDVKNTGKRSWVYRFTINGVTHEMGLGTPPSVSLAEARELRDDARKLVKRGINPIVKRREERAATATAEAVTKNLMTFRQAADGWLEKTRPQWGNMQYARAVESGLRRFCFPKIGTRPVTDVDVDDVMSVLKPIWVSKHPTASRLRCSIEGILNWAIAAKARTDQKPNPARWEILKHLLQDPTTSHLVKHHPYVPVGDVPAFMEELRKRPSLSARLLEFTILTATRSSEARKAEWKEIDWDARLWTVPAARMKGRKNKRKPHTVPLNTRAIGVLRELKEQGRDEAIIFPGFVGGQPLSDAACGKVLEMMGRTETLHGFRTSFRTWASEETDHAREICEKALAHTVGDETERAYDRGDLLKKRRKLMQDWCDFCLPPAVRLVNAA